MFQCRHYEFIAKTIQQAWPCDVPLQNVARARTAEAFADAFERDNPRFQRSRFLAACGISEER